MAPEIVVDIQNAQYSWPADIWSLGETVAWYANTCIVILLGCVMAFICNHGKHLFKHSSEVVEWSGLSQDRIPAEYSSNLNGLLGKMLHPDPKERPSASVVNTECTEERCGDGKQ